MDRSIEFIKNHGERKAMLAILISTSVEDGDGNIFYYKHFTYDSKDKGNIVEEREYGDRRRYRMPSPLLSMTMD